MEEDKEAYIDANVFIYAAINNKEEGAKAKNILARIENGEIMGFTSTLTFDEVFWGVKKVRSYEDAVKISEVFLNFPNLRFIDATYDIIYFSLKIIKKYNLNPRDAIHAASALSKEISLILSDDPDFDKVKELKRRSLKQFKV